MLEKRPGKLTDQEETEKAYQILLKAMQDNPDIESTLWVGAFWSCIVNGYRNCDMSYEEFCSELDSVKAFFKTEWDAP
jgi:hypothetical protein